MSIPQAWRFGRRRRLLNITQDLRIANREVFAGAEKPNPHWPVTQSGFETGSSIAQHVHMHIIEPGFATYWITSIVFSCDSLLTEKRRRDATEGRGGSGVVEPVRDETGTWKVSRDIVLGEGVPGYRH